jgi:hypothetical protein
MLSTPISQKIEMYACDVGSVARKRFWWCSSHPDRPASNELSALASAVIADLSDGVSVALGIECPLFIPCPQELEMLGRARAGECTTATGSKSFNSSPGACATMSGLPALGWVLRLVREHCPSVVATTKIDEFYRGSASLLLWEAFVTGSEAAGTHEGDARLALEAFRVSWTRQQFASRVDCEGPFSLVGAMILWANLSNDRDLLHHQCLVLRPLSTITP